MFLMCSLTSQVYLRCYISGSAWCTPDSNKLSAWFRFKCVTSNVCQHYSCACIKIKFSNKYEGVIASSVLSVTANASEIRTVQLDRNTHFTVIIIRYQSEHLACNEFSLREASLTGHYDWKLATRTETSASILWAQLVMICELYVCHSGTQCTLSSTSSCSLNSTRHWNIIQSLSMHSPTLRRRKSAIYPSVPFCWSQFSVFYTITACWNVSWLTCCNKYKLLCIIAVSYTHLTLPTKRIV